ncbi:TetR family transcriptional regulator [Amycolatopsis endophytica]|uniref:AcrR family transcriptional regulator n=1 Tax=Amycolatopsis endophytica TaxID=860233 RepID=A0A853B6E1_9PSEU|nr:TetR family transcriptional regulator [Amycolatopsis endophytica]NYI90337.1 AcrR family transcriptional regulator [Amycolatopsis endophytica]
MSTAEQPTPGKRRGRRPGGQDTRAALLDAARQIFSESGYEGATVRAIAARAGVDAAMVNHWFGGKEALFGQAVLQLPFDPAELLGQLMDGPVGDLGERIVRRFLTVWDATDGGAFPALVRSIASHELAALSLRDFLIRHVLENVVKRVSPDRPELRASLCASQMVGVGMGRYVAKFEPFSTTDVETLAAAIGPTLQRYLTGDIG